jgi:primosomal protein N'
LGKKLSPLIYHSDKVLRIGQSVSVPLQKKRVSGCVVGISSKPSFDTHPIEVVNPFYFSDYQIRTAHFIAEYYSCFQGEALALFEFHPAIL